MKFIIYNNAFFLFNLTTIENEQVKVSQSIYQNIRFISFYQ